jgi:hypothetical protein
MAHTYCLWAGAGPCCAVLSPPPPASVIACGRSCLLFFVGLCPRWAAEAGVKTWMLTGDKLETAVNIAYATQMLTSDMRIEVRSMWASQVSLRGSRHITAGCSVALGVVPPRVWSTALFVGKVGFARRCSCLHRARVAMPVSCFLCPLLRPCDTR